MPCGRKQEQGGRAVPIRRVAACGYVVKSMTGLPYRHLQGLESVSIHEDSKPGYTAARIAPFNVKCAEHMLIKGSIHSHDYDEDVFPYVQI